MDSKKKSIWIYPSFAVMWMMATFMIYTYTGSMGFSAAMTAASVAAIVFMR